MNIGLREITDSSWIITADLEPVGMLSKYPSKEFFMILGTEKNLFTCENELLQFLDVNSLDEIVERKKEEIKHEYTINGYPVELADAVVIENHESGYPSFKKRPTSAAVFCAGYYCVYQPSGWIEVFCPKWTTLKRAEHLGPFITQVECRAALASIKK